MLLVSREWPIESDLGGVARALSMPKLYRVVALLSLKRCFQHFGLKLEVVFSD